MNEPKEVEIVEGALVAPQEKPGALSVQKRLKVDDVIEQMKLVEEVLSRAMVEEAITRIGHMVGER